MLVGQELNKTVENFTYNINNLLGKGAFSSVYLGKCNVTGETVAIKVINLGSLTVDTYQKLQEELAILNSLPPHPNIIKVYRLFQTIHNAYIITEHCDRKITKNSDYDNTSIALGIIEGLKHLYKNNIVHRDLKPDNILIKNGVAKIIDFGFAKNISSPFEKMNQNLGTPLYMTPQIFDNMVYSSKCDIWSLGVTLHELVFKCDPYRAKDIEDLKRKIKTIQPPIFMVNNNDPLTNIIKRCLVVDQNQRISWQQLFTLSQQLKFNRNNINSFQNISYMNINNVVPIIGIQVNNLVPLVYY